MVRTAILAARRLDDQEKVRRFARLGLDCIAWNAAQRQVDWPTLPRPPEPPDVVVTSEDYQLLRRHTSWEYAKTALEEGRFLTGMEQCHADEFIQAWAFSYDDLELTQMAMHYLDIAREYKGTPIEALARYQAEHNISRAREAYAGDSAFDFVLSVAEESLAAANNSSEANRSATSDAASSTTSSSSPPDSSLPPHSRDSRRISSFSRALPYCLLTLAVLLFAASIYTFRRKGPPEKAE